VARLCTREGERSQANFPSPVAFDDPVSWDAPAAQVRPDAERNDKGHVLEADNRSDRRGVEMVVVIVGNDDRGELR
jgi:hypothetical protein